MRNNETSSSGMGRKTTFKTMEDTLEKATTGLEDTKYKGGALLGLLDR